MYLGHDALQVVLLTDIRYAVVVFLCLATISTTLGCAKVIVKRVPYGNNDSIEGVRFYRPVPYFVVSEASGGGSTQGSGGSSGSRTLQFTITWMPDLSQEYAIQLRPGLGSVGFNPTLENGWNLTGLNATVDSKAGELLTTVAGLIPKAAAERSLAATGGPSLKPGMYPFLFEQDRNSPNYGRLKGIDLAHPVFTIP
jgi:hypothetical protein